MRIIYFAPEVWDSLDRFHRFYFGTYTFGKEGQSSLSGAFSHLRKVEILIDIARQHVSLLNQDEDQVKEIGFTPTIRGRELAALIEAVVLTAYSAVDCTRAVVSYIYKQHRGVKQSTRKLFKAASDGTIATTVPASIRAAFLRADWYPELMRLRDAITHSDTGSCSIDVETRQVYYLHYFLGDANRAYVKKDVFAYLDTVIESIKEFSECIFAELCRTLRDEESRQLCGVFGGLIYERMVRPSEALAFLNGGRCLSRQWFEAKQDCRCPFAEECGAYRASERI